MDPNRVQPSSNVICDLMKISEYNVSFCWRLPQLSTSKPCDPLQVVSRHFPKFIFACSRFPADLSFVILAIRFQQHVCNYCFRVGLSPHVYVFGSLISGVEFAWFLLSPSQSLQTVWTAATRLLLATAAYLLNIIHSSGFLHGLYDK